MTTPDAKRIEAEDPSIVETTVEELRPLYRQMLAIRRMEEAAAKAYSQGKIGGHVPIAAGAAFASKYRGDGRVTLCFFGEGASTIGGFAEGLALAALWKLPVVLICENNQYSMGTPLYRSLAVEDVSLRALAHGMAPDRFAGADVLKVKRRVAEAVERARTTGEPTLVEVVTYRFRGHSMSDPGLYRT